MSTVAARRSAGRLIGAGVEQLSWAPFGPLDLAAIMAAQAHGALVWAIVLAGLGGSRRKCLPVLNLVGASASAQLATNLALWASQVQRAMSQGEPAS